MKPDKHLVGALGIILTTMALIALTWMGTLRSIQAQRLETAARVNATLSNQALTLSQQVNRQLLALDQTPVMFAAAWQADPAGYGMAALETRLRMILAAVHAGDMMALTPASVAAVEVDLAEAARLLRDAVSMEAV